ncbi:MAG: hypothetical protein HQM15_02890 [Deltaproteobacteria bacterium]|nr:hypothetical protein [Deltaproteobacteria bacterium]
MTPNQIANGICCVFVMGVSLYLYRNLERRRMLLLMAGVKIKEWRFMIDYLLFFLSIAVLAYLCLTLLIPEKF